MNASLIISISVFISMLLLLAGIVSYYEVRRSRKEIVDKIKGAEERLILEQGNDYAHPDLKSLKSHFHRFISSLGNKMKPEGEEETRGLRLKLLQAGYRGHNATIFYFGYKVFLAALLAMLLLLFKLFFIKAVQPGSFMIFVTISAVVGFYMPNLWLKIKTDARKDKILEGFPDALDLMVVCVEAGMGIDATINRVGEEMKLRNSIVSEEFRQMGLELRAGKLRQEALRNLGNRTGLDDVRSLMTLLIQTDRFGTSIAQALRVHSDSMRTRRYLKAEEMAAKLPVKLVFPLILFILPALFVVVAGPAVIRVFRVLLPALGN